MIPWNWIETRRFIWIWPNRTSSTRLSGREVKEKLEGFRTPKSEEGEAFSASLKTGILIPVPGYGFFQMKEEPVELPGWLGPLADRPLVRERGPDEPAPGTHWPKPAK